MSCVSNSYDSSTSPSLTKTNDGEISGVSSSPTDGSWLVENSNSPCIKNKVKKPRRLRKQINNDQFKQCYFELKVNDTTKKPIETQLMTSTTDSTTSRSTLNSPNSSDQVASLKRNESYEILQFESTQEKDEETLYQERIKNEIKASSHHFCLSSKKKKRKSTNQQDNCQPSIINNSQNPRTLNVEQQPCNTITYQPMYQTQHSISYHPTYPVNNQISNDTNNELMRTILQLLLYSNNKN